MLRQNNRTGTSVALLIGCFGFACDRAAGQCDNLAYQMEPGPAGRCAGSPYWGYYPIVPVGTANCVDPSVFSYLNLNPAIGLCAGDFPPLSRDLKESTSPLVSAAAQAVNRASTSPERQTWEGLVDLATGVPLIREVDFELPFGGAVFRHIRTFSEEFINHGPLPAIYRPIPNDNEVWGPDGVSWDWNGASWSISENPVFLMDADYCVPDNMPKRCYLLPDATHAIPFIWEQTGSNESDGRYIAPPWFDATCTRVNPGNANNAIFEIWLYGRSIKYTFHVPLNWRKGRPEYDTNAGQFIPGDWHAAPSGRDDAWHGLPYLGLVQMIEDRYGNRIEMTYTELRQWDIGEEDEPNCPPCLKCGQNSNEYGQLKAVKLYPAGEATAAWTLLYSYRQFGLSDDPASICATARRPHHIHAIYAYPIDIAAAQLPADSSLVAHWSQFALAHSLDEIDQIEAPFVEGNAGGFSDWTLRAKYTYSNGLWTGNSDSRDEITQEPLWPGEWLIAPNTDPNVDVNDNFPAYGLVKASVSRRSNRPGQSSPIISTEETMYRYQDQTPRARGGIRLAGKFSPTTVQALIEQMRNAAAQNGVDPNAPQTITLNYLLTNKNNLDDVTTCKTPDGGECTEWPLYYYADFWFERTDTVFTLSTARQLAGFCELNLPGIEWNVRQSFCLVDRRGGEPRVFYIWNFAELGYPAQTESGPLRELDYTDWTKAGMIHFPFVYRDESGTEHRLPTSAPAWTTVVDEVKAGAYCPDCIFSTPPVHPNIASRRQIGLNSAGFPVFSRTWEFIEGAPVQIEQLGYADLYTFDCSGRMLEKRTKGWSAIKASGIGDQETDGLIFQYEYGDPDCHNFDGECRYCHPDGYPCPPDDVCEPSREPIAVYIKKGTAEDATAKYPLRRVTRGVPFHSELVSSERVFSIQGGGENDYDETTYQYTFHDRGAEGIEEELWPLASRRVLGPITTSAGGKYVQSIQKTTWDNKGREIWSGRGLKDAVSNNVISFYSVHAEYDDYGHLLRQYVDVDTTAIPPPDAEYTRVPASSDVAIPMHLLTEYEYDNAYGVTRIDYPNGRETRMVYQAEPLPTLGLMQWVYKDLVPNENNTYRILGPIGVTRTEKGKLVYKKTVDGASFDGIPDGDEPNWADNVLSDTQPRYDAAGNVVGVVQAGQDVDPLQASLSYIGLGGVSREEAVDGTIKHYRYDDWGRLSHTYQGTSDNDLFWGAEVDPNSPPDNMALIEKRAYGSGPTNADQLITLRTYRDKPINQYDDPNLPATNENTAGWFTLLQYDWRMRNVASTRYAIDPDPSDTQQAPAVSTTLTWLDNQDRPRMVAEYSGAVTLAGTLDPRNVGVNTPTPAAATILAASTPLSLTETIYNPQGQPVESRSYKVSDISGESFTATITDYDEGNRPIEVRSPGSPIQRYVYDAKGRQVLSVQLADILPSPPEISKTRTVFDNNDRAIRTQRWERRADVTGPVLLNESNSVCTYSETWYDDAGKVIASANYGTNSGGAGSSGAFVYAPAPWSDITQPQGDPPQVSSPGVLVTRYGYDSSGRQNEVIHPDGTVTRSGFDGLGRLRLQIENATATDANDRRLTAYHYDNNGRLSKIAAVLPGHVNGTVADWNDVEWTESDGSLQVTEMIFADGAVVVDSAGVEISRNQSWVAEVHYPHRTTGQPDPAHSLKFTYFSDGSVASRTDAIGVRFDYRYDEQARLIQVDATYPPPADHCLASQFTPPDRVQRVTFAYDAESKLVQASAYALTDGNLTLLAQNAYGYDGFDNLQFEQQAVRGAASANSPQINYDWTFASAYNGGGNFNRLDQMTYPRRLNSTLRRQIDLQYGDAGGPQAALDEALHRVAKIQDLTNGGGSASYAYAGSSRRAALTFWSALAAQALVVQSLAGSVGVPPADGLNGLDAFGRTRDLHYVSPSGVPGSPGNPGIPAGGTLHRYEYNYDLAGNRTHARVYQQPAIFWTDAPVPPSTSPLSHDDDRSAKYTYDGLQRLIAADLGVLDAGGPGVPPGMSSPTRSVDWSLDNLGNWTGSEGSIGVPPVDLPGLTIVQAPPPTAPSGTPPTVMTVDHAVGLDNSLASVTREITGGGNPPGSPATSDFIVNLAGNTVLDGAYYYQYDAWNRLIEVRLKGSLSPGQFNALGIYQPCPLIFGNPPPGTPGDWVVRYVYDGLGRLVEKSTPVFGGQNETRREEYHYDGVRRIQELVRRESAITVVPGGEGGEPNPEGQPGDPVPSGGLGLEEPAEVTPGEPLAPVEVVVALPAGWDQREYVWGPDYVDELAWQVDKDGRPYYALLDANYNVMAIVAGTDVPPSSGDPPGTPTIPAGAVVEQYVWSPYGELLSRDVFDRRVNPDGTPTPTTGKLVTDAGAARAASGSDPGSPGTAGASLPGIRNKVGHQGLFFERFDGLNTDPPLVPTDTTAVSPTAPAGRGKGLYFARNRWYDAMFGRFFTADPNASGSPILSALAYHGAGIVPAIDEFSGQTRYRDGLSLFAFGRSNPLRGGDPMGLVYDPFEEVDQWHADLMGHRIAALGALVDGAHAGLGMGVRILSSFLPGGGILQNYLDGTGAFDGDVGFWDYVEMGMEVAPLAGPMLAKAFSWGRKLYQNRIARGAGRAIRCVIGNSFALGTAVSTPFGLVPIESLRTGSLVISTVDGDFKAPLTSRPITKIYDGVVDCVIWLFLSDGRTLGVTGQHLLLTAESNWRPADELVVGDMLTDASGSLLEIVEIILDHRQQAVFNFEVGGTGTYLAENVIAHNCGYREKFLDALMAAGKTMPNGYEVHHRIPQRFRGLFPDDEIDAVRNLAGVDPDVHTQITRMWENWAERYWEPTREQVMQFKKAIDGRFGNHYITP